MSEYAPYVTVINRIFEPFITVIVSKSVAPRMVGKVVLAVGVAGIPRGKGGMAGVSVNSLFGIASIRAKATTPGAVTLTFTQTGLIKSKGNYTGFSNSVFAQSGTLYNKITNNAFTYTMPFNLS